MKIACVDKTAAARLKLKCRLEAAYESGRASVGHLPLADFQICSQEELFFRAAPNVVFVGPEYSPDEAFACCREIREKFADTAIVVYLYAEHYSLRALRRFEKASDEVFSVDESPTRVLHVIGRFQNRRCQRKAGRSISLCGVKGGVGVTTIAGGLAHAAQAQGMSAVLVDLSPSAALLHYMAVSRWQSPELGTTLLEGIPPDAALVERCVVTSPNGITLFLPPAGSSDVRELWLREPKRLEYSLSCLDHLKDRFDLVMVDLSSAEGLLPFAIQARADVRMMISSNDPASVHLLTRKIAEHSQIPGDGEILLLLSMLTERGLCRNDILDFLFLNKSFREEMARLPAVSFDARGRGWIGTGNSFYTEGKKTTRQVLEQIVELLANPNAEVAAVSESRRPFRSQLELLRKAIPLEGLSRLLSPPLRVRYSRRDEQQSLPEPISPAVSAESDRKPEREVPRALEEDGPLYEPPRFAVNG